MTKNICICLRMAFTAVLIMPLIFWAHIGIAAPINDKFEAFGLLFGIYESPKYLSDECSRRYPAIAKAANGAKQNYIQRNKNTFLSAEKHVIELLKRERGASLKDFQDLMAQVRPDLDQQVRLGMNQYLGSQDTCLAALEGVNQGKLDLTTKSAQQLSIIFR